MLEATQRGSFVGESEMLPQDPPPWVVRASAQLLIILFAVGLLAAIVVRLPETVHCPFVLVPEKGADPIQSPRLAVVSKVSVSEGQKVAEGAELFVLRSEEIRGFDTQLRTTAEDLHAHEESLTNSDVAYISQLEIKAAEIQQAESEGAKVIRGAVRRRSRGPHGRARRSTGRVFCAWEPRQRLACLSPLALVRPAPDAKALAHLNRIFPAHVGYGTRSAISRAGALRPPRSMNTILGDIPAQAA